MEVAVFMNNLFTYSFFLLLIITIIISCLSIPNNLNFNNYGINQDDIYMSNSGFVWPLPNFYRISSYFGHRTSPTSYASSYHSGLDIPAPENTYFLATISGNIIYTGFNGSGGYTIILKNENIKVVYCHVSPNFLVSVGDYVEISQVIGQVGPYHVFDVLNNPYHDNSGIPTNRSNYWLSFTFCN